MPELDREQRTKYSFWPSFLDFVGPSAIFVATKKCLCTGRPDSQTRNKAFDFDIPLFGKMWSWLFVPASSHHCHGQQ